MCPDACVWLSHPRLGRPSSCGDGRPRPSSGEATQFPPQRKSLDSKPRLLLWSSIGRPVPRPALSPKNYSASIASGSTITNFPIDPLSRNLMRPVILAKSVSSFPRPTFSPGFTRVPRWRTMIVPPGTNCPPKALNPSRCAFESRPFREVPCPFLCAIKISFRWPVASCPQNHGETGDFARPYLLLLLL